jgi:putative PIG3 family NAD(P)H quinone oxidoreductase
MVDGRLPMVAWRTSRCRLWRDVIDDRPSTSFPVMRALILPSLAVEDRPDPVPRRGEILVRVRAAGLNRADLIQRAGTYPAPPGWPADIPGLEYAGEVAALGEDVTYWAVDDLVMGLVGGGGQAECVVVRQDEAMAIPDGMSFAEAAAIPEVFLTAGDALVRQGRARAGERVLFHAVGGGVGTAAVQLARLLGLVLIGTSRTADKLERCRDLGMDLGIDTSDADWVAQVGAPVQVIIDTLGAEVFTENLSLLDTRGRLVVLGTMTGSQAGTIDLGRVLRQRLTIVGTAMRNRAPRERAELIERFTTAVLPHFESGALRPVVERVFPMTEATAAYQLLASNEAFGKIVLSIDDRR